ncbi:MAG: hypothetical protein ACRCWH_09365 [Aeromonas veronii]
MKIFICVLVLSLLGSFAYLKLTSVSSKTPITVSANQSGEQDVQVIKAAFKDLASVCPAVTKDFIEEISGSRQLALEGMKGFEEATRAWQNLEYGWTQQVYFAVKSSPSQMRRYGGHTHHFYVATEGGRGVVIDGKQESLDFCGIKATMKDHFFIPVL